MIVIVCLFVGCSVIVGHYDITMCCTPQKFTRRSDPFLFSSFKWHCKLLLITLLIKKIISFSGT